MHSLQEMHKWMQELMIDLQITDNVHHIQIVIG
jgi:hypothetical protein